MQKPSNSNLFTPFDGMKAIEVPHFNTATQKCPIFNSEIHLVKRTLNWFRYESIAKKLKKDCRGISGQYQELESSISHEYKSSDKILISGYQHIGVRNQTGLGGRVLQQHKKNLQNEKDWNEKLCYQTKLIAY